MTSTIDHEEFHYKSQVGRSRSARGERSSSLRIPGSPADPALVRGRLREFPIRVAAQQPSSESSPTGTRGRGELNPTSKVSEHFNRVRSEPDYTRKYLVAKRNRLISST